MQGVASVLARELYHQHLFLLVVFKTFDVEEFVWVFLSLHRPLFFFLYLFFFFFIFIIFSIGTASLRLHYLGGVGLRTWAADGGYWVSDAMCNELG